MGSKSRQWALAAAAMTAIGLALATPFVRADRTVVDSKSAAVVQSAFTNVTSEASKSTVRIFVQDHGVSHAVALGTIISADGYILTKGSEVVGQPRVVVSLAGGKGPLEAQVIGWSEPLDLAMLKIEATRLTPVNFADTRPPAGAVADVRPGGRGRGGPGFRGFGRRGRGGQVTPAPVTVPVVAEPLAPPEGALPVVVGEWVATPDAGATIGAEVPPKYVGVISTSRRRIGRPDINVYGPPFMGVSFGDTDGRSVPKIVDVIEKTGAARAGIKGGDLITGIDGKPIKLRADLTSAMRSYNVGDPVILTVERDSKPLNLRVVLGKYPLDQPDPDAEILAGNVSKRSDDFPAVFQHDTLLEPVDCGGPLVDLDGHVIGINIARAGRTEAYALPADVVLAAIEPLKSGKLAPPAMAVPASEPAAR